MMRGCVDVVRADYVDGYRLRVVFSDGHESTVDFGPFLTSSRHPDVRKFLDAAQFAQFTVRDGDLMWGDYDMIFPVADLYRGSVT